MTVRVRDIDRYKRTVAEIILPDGRLSLKEIRSIAVKLILAPVFQTLHAHPCSETGT